MGTLRRWSARGASAVLGVALFAAGCGQPVREDRSIQWSATGQAVGFQHGQQGVFLADQEGGRLTKIFQPDSDTLAVSTPLWSPGGDRVLFCTARSRDGQPAVQFPPAWFDADPAGTVHTQRPVRYTCWLRDGAAEEAAPRRLFEADCDHVGYVAANLAVRWHPDGQHVLYVQQSGESEHRLSEFDLATQQSRVAFPHAAEALICDWTPDGKHLVCALGGTQRRRPTDGIWVGRPGGDWWQVPGSGDLARGELPSLLEQLRATRPAWTSDGTRFAFTTTVPGPTKEDPAVHSLRLGNLAARTVETVATGPEPFRDLCWAPDGNRVGVVRGGEGGTLHWWERSRGLSAPVNRRPVRRFAGWNAKGDRLAYVVPDAVPRADGDYWALLLVPEPLARDAVCVADGAGRDPGTEVFSGMRITFPRWSPADDRLSLWGTFSPTHRSWISALLGWGLRPGDPAAVLDVRTGKLSWMAVNAHEKVQVGHYHLLKRAYAEAWHWYAEAEREASPAPGPVNATEILNLIQSLDGPRDFRFFAYYCLTKLGRRAEAQERLAEFRAHFFPPVATAPGRADAWERTLQEFLSPQGFPARLLQDLYIVEVYLSLDAGPDGEAFFRDALRAGGTDAERMSSAVALGQLLLVRGRYEEYADLAKETIVPLLARRPPPRPAAKSEAGPDLQQALTDLVAAYSLMPLTAREFVARLPRERLHAMAGRWRELRAKAAGDNDGKLIDATLCALYQQLGWEKERRALAGRLQLPVGPDGKLSEEKTTETFIASVREHMRRLPARR